MPARLPDFPEACERDDFPRDVLLVLVLFVLSSWTLCYVTLGLGALGALALCTLVLGVLGLGAFIKFGLGAFLCAYYNLHLCLLQPALESFVACLFAFCSLPLCCF